MGRRPSHGVGELDLRVLLVEDDRAFATFLEAALLGGQEAAAVRIAYDLADAREALTAVSVDAVLLDLNLPDSQGLATLRGILEASPDVAVVVLTGVDDAGVARSALRLGAQDWLVKGEADPRALERALRYAIERKALTARLLRAQKLEVVGRLASDVAHEFNNVLTAVAGSAALVADAPDSASKDAALELLQRSVRQGTVLSRQLLSLTRSPMRHDAVVDASTLVANAVGLIQAILPSSIELVAGPAASATVRVDPGQFDQVLLNLVLNARDAMPTGGTLTIGVTTARAGQLRPAIGTLEPGKQFAVFRVIDTGTGIDDTVLPRLFEPFFTTKDHRGTGLGLAVVAEIIARFHGAIQVDSRLGGGTTFSVILPTYDA
jgi:two-component system, cell cycle sensor histidine kinase and response regulator CckA